MKQLILTLLIGLVVVGGAALLLLYSGVYSISVYNHDNALINWAMELGMARSVVHHAKGITVPDLSDRALVREGFQHYQEMCVQCHGAPGVEPGEIAHGLWPTAPDLARTVPEWKPAELFWITRNGIKFTAMPAWGPTHKDEQIWAMVAFLQQLPHLSASDYQKMRAAAKPGPPPDHHADHD